MNVTITDSYDAMSRAAADVIATLVLQQDQRRLVCMLIWCVIMTTELLASLT